MTCTFNFNFLGTSILCNYVNTQVQAFIAPPSLTATVTADEVVPAVYFDLAKETHSCAMKFIMKVQEALAPY